MVATAYLVCVVASLVILTATVCRRQAPPAPSTPNLRSVLHRGDGYAIMVFAMEIPSQRRSGYHV